MIKKPFVSIIIVNFNSGAMLGNCLTTLERQLYKNFEVILVDNGSTDGSLAYVGERPYPVMVLKLGENSGFAVANNRGAEKARADSIIFLNTDAFPQNIWLSIMVQAVEKYPHVSAFTSHQVSFYDQNILDGTGDIYATNGRAWRRDYGAILVDGINKDDEVFGFCAAAAFIQKDIFLKLGGFDEDYFCYFEDVDFSLRLRLAGHTCMHIAKAVVFHIGSATSGGADSDFSIHYGYRNLVWTYFKSMPLGLLLKYLPGHLFLNCRHLRDYTMQNRFPVIFRSKLAALLGLPKILLFKRPKVQRTIKISSRELEKKLVTDPV